MILLFSLMLAAAPSPADATARLALSDYADCIVKEQPEVARTAVLEDWEPRRLTDALLRTQSGCARPRQELRFQGAVIKAAMAGALAKRELGPSDIASVPTAPPLAYDMPEPLKTVDEKGKPLSSKKIEAQQEAIRKKAGWVAIAQFGECVARANPAAVPALLESELGSDAEMTAIKAFGPQMPACLRKGVKLELDRSTLRNSLAVGYYRLAMAARGGAGREAAR